MVKGRNYSKVDGFDKTLSRFKGKKHKSIVSNLLRNNDKVKKIIISLLMTQQQDNLYLVH
jgi:hypothetical protein